MRHFDAHPYRTEDVDGVWDFARGCMRTYLILQEKARVSPRCRTTRGAGHRQVGRTGRAHHSGRHLRRGHPRADVDLEELGQRLRPRAPRPTGGGTAARVRAEAGLQAVVAGRLVDPEHQGRAQRGRGRSGPWSGTAVPTPNHSTPFRAGPDRLVGRLKPLLLEVFVGATAERRTASPWPASGGRPTARDGGPRPRRRRPAWPAKLWNDTESAPDADELVPRLGGPGRWAALTGSVPGPAFTVAKLAWLARVEPKIHARVARVLLPHDWLTWQLSGSVVTDRGDASGTGYFSPVTDTSCPRSSGWSASTSRPSPASPGRSRRWANRGEPRWPPGPATTWPSPSGWASRPVTSSCPSAPRARSSP